MARGIFETMRDIRNGALLNEAASDLAEVVRAVSHTNKGGEICIRIKVKPVGAASATLMVDGEVTKKVPVPDREVSIFFPTVDGSLTKTDPNQMPLGLSPVPSSSPPPPNAPVDLSTGEVLHS